MPAWSDGKLTDLALEEIGERYARYRLPCAQAEREMARSLRDHGQLSPIVVCLRDNGPELIDGFKRLRAARELGLRTLCARVVEADERAAKAAIYTLNCAGGRPKEIEEAWIIHALVREDGLSQIEVAERLGRHKSWVCRRLALVEKLCAEAREDVKLGVLSATAAREMTRLPRGNQTELLEAVHREDLTIRQIEGVVDLLLASTGESQRRFVLAHPREALSQAEGGQVPASDPRLSPAGNRICRKVGLVRDLLAQMENWLRCRGRADLTPRDRAILDPAFESLGRDARAVAELVDDFLGEEAA
jgi:ParB/RepB/Spo0J family partition protein